MRMYAMTIMPPDVLLAILQSTDGAEWNSSTGSGVGQIKQHKYGNKNEK